MTNRTTIVDERGALCDVCNGYMLVADGCRPDIMVEFADGENLPAVKWGEEKWIGLTDLVAQLQADAIAAGARCHDCGALPGHTHHPGCDTERCPRCNGQAIGCGCSIKGWYFVALADPSQPAPDPDSASILTLGDYDIVIRPTGTVSLMAPSAGRRYADWTKASTPDELTQILRKAGMLTTIARLMNVTNRAAGQKLHDEIRKLIDIGT